MRIVHCVRSLECGGTERFVQRLVNSWPSRGYDHIVLTFFGGTFVEEFEEQGIRVFVLSKQGGLRGVMRAVQQLHAYFSAYHCDLVISSHWLSSAVLKVLCRRFSYPLVVVQHNNASYLGFVRRFIDRTLKILGFKPARTVAVSDQVASSFREAGFEVDQVIVNGVEKSEKTTHTAKQRASLRKKLGIPPHASVLLVVGRLDKRKGVYEAVDALEILTKQYRLKGVHLVFVGDGPEEAGLKQHISRSSLDKKVHLVGYQQDMTAWYKMADLYLSASYSEGLSLALLEACAAGMPILITGVSGAEMLLNRGVHGIVVPSPKPALIAAGFKDFYDKPAFWSRYARQNESVVFKTFSWQGTLAAYVKLARDLLLARSGRRFKR